MSKINFPSNGHKLAGNLFMPQQAPQAIAFLFIQGWTGYQNVQAAQTLTDLGFPTMTYDMRGNRESEGELAKFSRADFIKDAVVAYDYLRQQVGPETAIGVVGSSFGGYTAVLLSKERDVYCLSLRVPAAYPDEGFNEPQLYQADSQELRVWRQKKLSYTKNHAFEALHNFGGKVQIIEAEADEEVPHQCPENYADAIADKSNLTYEVMPDAPHSLVNQQLQKEYEKRLTAWVTTLG